MAEIDLFLGLVFLMLGAHALCDLPLQPARLSDAKRPGGDPAFHWSAALAGHGLIHGLAVALVTGFWWLGLAEAIAHAAIDGAKGRGRVGMIADQALHLACKLIWALVAVE